MKIISPSFEIMSPVDGKAVLNHIEKCGRVCYKSCLLYTSDAADEL